MKAITQMELSERMWSYLHCADSDSEMIDAMLDPMSEEITDNALR